MMNFVFPFASPLPHDISHPVSNTSNIGFRFGVLSHTVDCGELRIALFIMECWRMLAPKANEQQVVIIVPARESEMDRGRA